MTHAAAAVAVGVGALMELWQPLGRSQRQPGLSSCQASHGDPCAPIPPSCMLCEQRTARRQPSHKGGASMNRRPPLYLPHLALPGPAEHLVADAKAHNLRVPARSGLRDGNQAWPLQPRPTPLPRHATPRHATPRHATPRHRTLPTPSNPSHHDGNVPDAGGGPKAAGGSRGHGVAERGCT